MFDVYVYVDVFIRVLCRLLITKRNVYYGIMGIPGRGEVCLPKHYLSRLHYLTNIKFKICKFLNSLPLLEKILLIPIVTYIKPKRL